MIVYLIQRTSYDGDDLGPVYADEAEAITAARAQARRYNEEFGGCLGCGVCLWKLTPGEDPETVAFANWKTRIEGGRFVVAE